MENYLLPRLDLTPEQLRVVDMDATSHRVVFGPPGSGKTQVLTHRAAVLRDGGGVPPERFRIFVFTNVLKDYIRSGLEMLDLPPECVMTFDQWCTDMYRHHLGARLPWNKEAKTFDFSQIRSDVLQLVRSEPRFAGMLDFALVDEGQDLTQSAFDILHRVAKHVTVFADHNQQIFAEGANEAQMLSSLGVPRRHLTLLADYRNSPDVARLAAYFISDEQERASYLARVPNNQAVRERPLCFVASSAEEEMDRLAEVVRGRLVMNQRVGIIVSQNRQVHGLAKGLDQRGIKVEKAIKDRRPSGDVEERILFQTNPPPPLIATYHNAKGLTFDAVMMPRLTESSFYRTSGIERARLLFVGISRATQWVYLSTLQNKQFSEYAQLLSAVERHDLSLQYGNERGLFGDDLTTVVEDDFLVL